MSFVAGVVPQGRVLRALILRETRTRFGNYQLGYLWALLEPLIVILTFYVMLTVAGRNPPAGMDTVGFLATGFVPYQMFSNGVGRVASSINGNKGLLFYPQIRPLDIAIARTLLEFGTYVSVFGVLMVGNGLIVGELAVYEVLWVIVGLALAGLLGASIGLVITSVSVSFPTVDKLYGPILRPLFWVSGIFFTAASIPSWARELLLWNPVLHTVELVRSGWYESYDSTYADLRYVLAWVFGAAFCGLVSERSARRRLEVA